MTQQHDGPSLLAEWLGKLDCVMVEVCEGHPGNPSRHIFPVGRAKLLEALRPTQPQAEGLVRLLEALACDCDAGEANDWEEHEWQDAAALLRRAAAALRSPEPSEGWMPIETAPKDGTRILAILRADEAQWPNRCFEVWHEGSTESGHDLGWTLFPGYGGVSDKHFAGWMPLPQPPRALSVEGVG